jgi:transposase-like protein
MTKNISRKRYELEFKQEAVKLLESGGYSLSEGAMGLGISKSGNYS